MASYATQADFEAYVEGWVTDNAAALARLLERATRDIDRLLAARPIITSGTYAGHKVDPTKLRDHDRAALARVVCAQAEYRFDAGEATHAAHGHGGRVRGPDFEQELPKGPTGGRPRIGPKVAEELDAVRWLIPTGARARA
jgi:hypothetical protein